MERLGRYEIIGRIGSGGMAEVMLGRMIGPRGFQQPVVIKRILPHLTDDNAVRQMFLKEARTVARVRHHNVVQVIELCEDSTELFLVMQYLEGENAYSLIRSLAARKKRLSIGTSVHVVAEACAGLEAAHAVSVVHRDVSASNIFITYDGGVKLIDFGIAIGGEQNRFTEPGHVRGKLAYMSPEQAQAQPVDARSDLFSAGVVLFELSLGRRLFVRENPATTLKALLHDPIPAPTEFVSNYPPELAEICEKALSRDPDLRFQSARDFRAALLEFSNKACESDPAQLIARVMRKVFRDRIEQKESMLDKLQGGGPITSIPRNVVDEGLPLPSPVLADTSEVMGETPSSQPLIFRGEEEAIGATATQPVTRRTRKWPFIALLFAAGSIALFWGVQRSLSSSDPSIVNRPTVEVRVLSIPADSEVFVERSLVGRTPATVRLAQAERAVSIRVLKAGYQPYETEIIPSSSRVVSAQLTKIPAAAVPLRAETATASMVRAPDFFRPSTIDPVAKGAKKKGKKRKKKGKKKGNRKKEGRAKRRASDVMLETEPPKTPLPSEEIPSKADPPQPPPSYPRVDEWR